MHVRQHSAFVNHQIIRLIQFCCDCAFLNKEELCKKLFVFTTFPHSINVTRESNENGRFSAFPASRGLSQRDIKLKREERDLCRLPTSCLMKPPTKFLVETYRFSKPVLFDVQCACLVRLYADNYRAHGRLSGLWLPRDLRVSKFLNYKIVCFYAWR